MRIRHRQDLTEQLIHHHCSMVSIYIILSLVTIFSSLTETNGLEEPTMANYFLKELDLLGRENWRFLMPNDTDIDQDGKVSDLEVECKIHSYLGELFNIMDQDKDNIITEEEMKSPKFEISEFTDKVIDIALENFPVKSTLLAADANGDGFYDEDDFYLPAKLLRQRPNQTTTKARLSDGHIPELYMEVDQFFLYTKIAQVGDNEGAVLCRSLGFEGLNRTIEQQEQYHWDRLVGLSCQGNESRLEDCQLINLEDQIGLEDEDGLEDKDYYEYEYKNYVSVNYVSCTGEQKLGSLHLIGGKDSSAGDIFFGDKGLGCIPHKEEWIDQKGDRRTYGQGLDELSEVICRDLGFPGFIKTTRGSAFTKNIKPDKTFRKYHSYDYVLHKGLSCIGTETKIADCEITDGQGQVCDSRSVAGIVCKTDTRKGVDEDLANIVGWNDDIWEKFGRFLFIADSNGDKKLTLDEIAEKAKTYVSGILEFLDQTQDGHISIDDFTSLNIKVEPIHRILDLAFDVFANKTSDDIDLLALKIADISLDELVGDYLEKHDENRDGKLNALDFFTNSGFEERYKNYNTKERYLITFLNMKLDKNQDGKLQRLEIKQFINEMFGQLDRDKSDEITLEDVYQMMQTHGFDCFQLGAVKTFVTIILDTAQTQFGKFMSYLFKLYDLDSNKRVTLEEFQKMKVPCDMEETWSPGSDGSLGGCHYLKDDFSRHFLDFPDLEMKSRRRNRYDEEDEDTVVDKLAKAACQMLT